MTDVDAKMAQLRQRFVVRATVDRGAIAAALAERDRARLLQLTHGLAGIAGIFGHADISVRASAAEQAIDADKGDEEVAARIEALILALDLVARETE